MSKPIPFVGYQSELAYIDSVIREWGTLRVVCIDAPAGGGKTRLMQELRQRYTSTNDDSNLVVTDIIDFNDPTMHKLQNIGYTIAQTIDPKIFEPYLRVLLNWRKMELSGVGFEQLSQAARAVNQTFISCFNMITARVILLVDTLDALGDLSILHNLIQSGKQLQNVVVVLAGRNVQAIGESLSAELGKDVKTIILPPLSQQAAQTYMHHLEKELRISLEPALIDKLIFLSNGRVPLLDLSVKRFAHPHTLPWLTTCSLSELEAASPAEHQQRQHEFERELANHIAHTQQLKGWLTLILAHIYPLDVAMTAELLAIPEDTARSLLDSASQYVDIKQLPHGRICLHDDIQRIINDHAWPGIDANGDKRRRQSKLTVDYMQRRIADISQRLDELYHTTQQLTYEQSNTRSSSEPFLERTALEWERHHLHVQQLRHTIFINSEEGLQTFITKFDQTTQTYNLSLRKKLLTELQSHTHHLTPESVYELDSRRVRLLLDECQYQEAYDLATRLITNPNRTPAQHIAMLIERGNASIRLGHYQDAMEDFDQAIELSQMHQLENWLVQAQHARGWAYSNQGIYDQALADYLESYQGCLRSNNTEQIAWILNHISYIHALRGNRHAAIESCHAALELWEELDAPRGLAAAYTTMGEVYVRFNQPHDALAYYTRGLNLFAHQNDLEWMSTVRVGRAFAFQTLRELDKAVEEQNWALAHGPVNLKPRILYSQALNSLLEHKVEQARSRLEACRQISQQIGDRFNDYKSFADLVELAWEQQEWSRWQTFYDEHNRLYAQRKGIDALRLRGSCLRKIADLAICAGNYDIALETYQHGLPLIAQYEVHERYTIRSQIKQTDNRLRVSVPGKVLHRLGQDLTQFWLSRDELVTKYPEVLLLFRQW
jgi:tetratricopeptide (TPR) repeat protein